MGPSIRLTLVMRAYVQLRDVLDGMFRDILDDAAVYDQLVYA